MKNSLHTRCREEKREGKEERAFYYNAQDIHYLSDVIIVVYQTKYSSKHTHLICFSQATKNTHLYQGKPQLIDLTLQPINI